MRHNSKPKEPTARSDAGHYSRTPPARPMRKNARAAGESPERRTGLAGHGDISTRDTDAGRERRCAQRGQALHRARCARRG